MSFQFKSLKQILDVFIWKEPLWATEISEKIWKSNVIVHKYLKELVTLWKIKKVWSWPVTKYKLVFKTNDKKLSDKKTRKIDINISFSDRKLLDDIFLKFSPDWAILKWFDWIKIWCEERALNGEDKIKAYINIYKHIQKLQDTCWLIDAKSAFWKDFDDVYLDNVYYADQYKWMDFWRWKLAELAFYWKQSQNKTLINETIDEVIYKLECLVRKNNYDAIGIVPWSIERKNQLLKILKNKLKNLFIPFVKIIKYYSSWIPIPQKTLKTREQRILNAKNTIFIDDRNISNYKKILLIDDFVWSWSTLNETAKKLKEQWVETVDWLAFVGNLNLSYEVINEI